MLKMIDTLARKIRDARPFRILMNNRGDAPTGTPPAPPAGDPPAGDPPANPPPAGDPPPTDQNWITSLPDDVKSTLGEDITKDPNITKYKDMSEFLKGHVNLAKMIGDKGVILPKDDATPEQREEFYNALGRPKTPEEYKLAIVENLHENVSVTPESEAAFKTAAHKMGFTNNQVNDLNKWFLTEVSNMQRTQDKAETEAVQKAETDLRAEWKDTYDTQKSLVAKLMMNAGGQEAIDAMGGVDGIGNSPHILKALGKIAGLLSEDQISNMRTVTGPSGGNESQQDALTKISAMNTDPDNAWNKALNDPNHLKHAEAVSERMRLYKIAYPGGG